MNQFLKSMQILIVDDTPHNIDILVDALDDDYSLMVATSGSDALEAVNESVPDLILLDIMMPGMDGFETCRRLKETSRYKDIPVIFLTALDDISKKTEGFSLGAVDYITKPFEAAEVKSRVETHLTIKNARELLRDQNTHLEQMVRKRTRTIQNVQDVTIRMAASLAETRDNETGNHILRTQQYVKVLAQRLLETQNAPAWGGGELELLVKSAPLHDIGKIGVPDAILLKPGKLEPFEFEEMKRHTEYGREALSRAEKEIEGVSFLRMAREIAYSHHEKWDGTGYPEGLKEDAIPLSGRIMALGDVYDALISRRVYKPAFPHSKAVAIIGEGRGSHFDPLLVDCFLDIQDSFREIALNLAENDEEREALLR
jgi:putative two-component system response regulator